MEGKMVYEPWMETPWSGIEVVVCVCEVEGRGSSCSTLANFQKR
jgi:hypothetical protein